MDGTGTFQKAIRAASQRRLAGSNPPRAVTLGTPQAAQELNSEVTATATKTARLAGCDDLWFNPAYRAWIMELPQGSGRKVLQAFSRILLRAYATPQAGRADFLIAALRRADEKAW